MNKQELDIIKSSYLSKEDMIKLIENINFSYVRTCEIELITGFLYKKDADFKDTIEPLYITFKIE